MLVLCIHYNGYAQLSSAYVFFRPVYAFSANSSKLSEASVVAQGVTYTRGIYGSYGQGLSLQAGFGKMINTNFGFELAGEWLNGKKISTIVSADDNTSLEGESNERIRAVIFKPMLLLRNTGELMQIYSKLGLAIVVHSKRITQEAVALRTSGQDILLQAAEEDRFKAKVGYTAAFGLSFRISQSMALTTELNGQMISLPPKNGKYTSYQLNGKDELPQLKNSDKTWNFEKQVSTAPGDPNKPGTRIFDPANFSYIGLSLGLNYFF